MTQDWIPLDPYRDENPFGPPLKPPAKPKPKEEKANVNTEE